MIRSLNSLRFILILMIVISHSTLPISQGLHDYLGECAVAIFFVISGFVLSLSKGDKLQKGELSNKQFFLSRIIKLYPLHLLILALLIPLNWRIHQLGSIYQTIAQVLLLQCWYPSHDFMSTLNAATWFISDLIFFYLIFKYLYCWIMRYSWLCLAPIIAIYMTAYIILSIHTHTDYSGGYIYCFPPFRIIDFTIGILLYKFSFSTNGKKLSSYIKTSLTSWKIHVSDSFLMLLLTGMFLISIHCPPNIRCSTIYWLPSAIIVFYTATIDKCKGWLSDILHHPKLQWLGSISFEIFLCHNLCFRIIQSIFLRIYGEDNPYLGLQFILSLLFTILTAWIAKRYFTIPIHQKLQKRL